MDGGGAGSRGIHGGLNLGDVGLPSPRTSQSRLTPRVSFGLAAETAPRLRLAREMGGPMKGRTAHAAPSRISLTIELALGIGTGAPNVVRLAEEREAEEPTPGFLRALLRAAAREASAEDLAGGAAPLVEITRPSLSREHVGLACGHAAARPLVKARPRRIFCGGCAAGRPTDREIVEAAIDDASDEELRAYEAQIRRRAEARGLSIGRTGT